MQYQIQPLQDNILIRMREVDESSEKIIALPDKTDPLSVAKYPYGEVLSVGPLCKFVQPGDKVLFLAGNAIGFEHPNEVQYILPETCILAKYVPEALRSDETAL